MFRHAARSSLMQARHAQVMECQVTAGHVQAWLTVNPGHAVSRMAPPFWLTRMMVTLP